MSQNADASKKEMTCGNCANWCEQDDWYLVNDEHIFAEDRCLLEYDGIGSNGVYGEGHVCHRPDDWRPRV